MEGEEVKPGATVSCKAGDGFVIHLSQAALGETKKGSENVVVSIKVNDKKLVIGTLSAEKHPQTMYDLIFDQDFELSHSSKTTSVFLCGYKSQMPDMFEFDSGEDEDESDEEMETDKIPMMNNANEKSATKVAAEDSKKDKQDDDDDDDESDEYETSSGDDDLSESSESEMSSDEDELSSGEDEDISDESEEEKTPEKPQVGKKRSAETATPASDKKAKIVTPSGQKTGEKKAVHVSTPHPTKQASKNPADSKSKEKVPKTPADKSKEKSPKSGSHACKSGRLLAVLEHSSLIRRQRSMKPEGYAALPLSSNQQKILVFFLDFKAWHWEMWLAGSCRNFGRLMAFIFWLVSY